MKTSKVLKLKKNKTNLILPVRLGKKPVKGWLNLQNSKFFVGSFNTYLGNGISACGTMWWVIMVMLLLTYMRMENFHSNASCKNAFSIMRTFFQQRYPQVHLPQKLNVTTAVRHTEEQSYWNMLRRLWKECWRGE